MSRQVSYEHLCEIARRVFPGPQQRLQALPQQLMDFIVRLFHGQVEGWRSCDTEFHDFDHTMQASAAVLELLEAYRSRPAWVGLSPRQEEMTFAAVLFHDTGYLKVQADVAGTGAKYSAIHVGRSCLLAWDLLPAFGFTRDEMLSIQHAISATGVSVRMEQIGFRSEPEKLMGATVATGDMLGQMAAEDYPERLAGLYVEFSEASAFSHLHDGGFAAYANLGELLRGTEKFYATHVTHMLDQEWRGLHRLLADGQGGHSYEQRIRANLERVKLMAAELGQDS